MFFICHKKRVSIRGRASAAYKEKPKNVMKLTTLPL